MKVVLRCYLSPPQSAEMKWFFGKMIIGIFNVGDHIIIFPSGKKAKIESIDRHFEGFDVVICGDAAGLKFSVIYG